MKQHNNNIDITFLINSVKNEINQNSTDEQYLINLRRRISLLNIRDNINLDSPEPTNGKYHRVALEELSRLKVFITDKKEGVFVFNSKAEAKLFMNLADQIIKQ